MTGCSTVKCIAHVQYKWWELLCTMIFMTQLQALHVLAHLPDISSFLQVLTPTTRTPPPHTRTLPLPTHTLARLMMCLFCAGGAGALASVVHDGFMNPIDGEQNH